MRRIVIASVLLMMLAPGTLASGPSRWIASGPASGEDDAHPECATIGVASVVLDLAEGSQHATFDGTAPCLTLSCFCLPIPAVVHAVVAGFPPGSCALDAGGNAACARADGGRSRLTPDGFFSLDVDPVAPIGPSIHVWGHLALVRS